MTHSFCVTMVGGVSPGEGVMDAILDAFVDLIASAGGAGARAAGEPAEAGVDTAGEAMFALAR